MGNPSKHIISLKLLINKNTQTVLFAEASKDFIDFLFGLLSLSAAAIARLLSSSGEEAGALGSLYEGLETLSDTYIQRNADRNTLLNPNPNAIAAFPSILAASPAPENEKRRIEKVFLCHLFVKRAPGYGVYSSSVTCMNIHASDSPSGVCPNCKKTTSISVPFVESPATEMNILAAAEEEEEGVVRGVVTYVVMDDLQVNPMSAISIISLLNKFGVNDVSSVEERIVWLGKNQALKLLKELLQTKSVLTNVFL